MSHSRNPRNEDNQTIEESKDQSELLKKALHTAIKRQAELEKRVKVDTLNFSKERTAYLEEKNKLLEYIRNADIKNGQLITYSEQLESNLIEANKRNNDLIEALQKLESELIKANATIKNLTDALQQSQQTASSTLESKASNTAADRSAPAVTEPATGKEATAETAATAGTSSYSMFSPWRILGYNDTKATPTQENPAHISLADLTKASIEQALAEKIVSSGMRK